MSDIQPYMSDALTDEDSCLDSFQTGSTKSQSSERTLDAPDILDDYYLNLLDWSSTNKVSIGLGKAMYIWDAVTSAANELFSVDDDLVPTTSVSWTANGSYLAAGMNNSEVQLWNHNRGKMVTWDEPDLLQNVKRVSP